MSGARHPAAPPPVEALLDATVPVGGARVPVRALLMACLSGSPLVAPGAPGQGEAARLAARFIRAGAAELEAIAEADGWVQLDLGLRAAVPVALRREVAALVEGLLASGEAANAFFMHKPPGLRLRVQLDAASAAEGQTRLDRAAAGWVDAGLIESHAFARYEPEATLFGGPDAMREVHRLFTIDSAAWLALHALPAGPPVALAGSLLLLRHLFAGMGIVDWEDLDVWTKVRAMGRALGPARGALPAQAVAEVSEALVALWADPRAALSGLDEGPRAHLEEAASRLAAAAPRWRDRLRADATGTGPRAAAALYVVFLWNRAGLARERQALVAEALARRPVLG